MCDFNRGPHSYRVCSSERPSHSSSSVVISDLQSNYDYRFRLAAITLQGEELRSDFITARTGYNNGNCQQVPTSSVPKLAATNPGYHNNQEVPKAPLPMPAPYAFREILPRNVAPRSGTMFTLSWKYSGPGANANDLSYVLECADNENDDWRVVYRGCASTHTINEASTGYKANHYRVQAIRRNAKSAWSDILKFVPRPVVRQPPPAPEPTVSETNTTTSSSPTSSSAPTVETLKKIMPMCSIPTIKDVMWNQMTVQWGCDNSERILGAGTSTLIFELQRIDSQPIIIYSGVETRFMIEKLKPVEHVQLRVRGVLVDNDGNRLEGGWSPIGSACSLPHSPTPPQNLRIVELETTSGSEETTSNPATDNSDSSDETKLSQRHFVLEWNAPLKNNGSPVSEYRIFYKESGSDDEYTMFGSSAETYVSLEHVKPGETYLFVVAAMNEGGLSEYSSPMEYTAPAKPPCIPRDFHVESVGVDSASVSWTVPECNGSAVSGYRLSLYRMVASQNGSNSEEGSIERNAGGKKRGANKHHTAAPVALKPQLVSKKKLSNDQLTECGSLNRVIAELDSLLAASEYRISVCAMNAMGRGRSGSFDLETEALPPEPPMLMLLSASSNQLKLKWAANRNAENDSPTHLASMYFFVERENENGSFSSIYEGDYRTCKVRNLSELNNYRFRIRAARNRRSAPGPWSPVAEFQTTRSPPPPVRGVPSVSEVSEGLFQIDWQPVRCAGEDTDIFYRLQCAPKLLSERHETWKTVYEGLSTSYSFRLPTTNAPYQTRVVVVRMHDGEESASLPSPVSVFSRSPSGTPRKRPNPNADAQRQNADDLDQQGPADNSNRPSPSKGRFTVGRRSRFAWFYRLFGDRHMAFAWSVLVIIVTFSLANLFLL
ncbi:hypothetical protein L596_014425 [Steinernema carpocapsae]|uniref:Fibronectin type-III domain-containing protein n=1 Tax=Steinernema carpocapsae TaxID=34508 RepID=A0A4U5NBX1_STECR|nr:hypothetical protein L596_014425 [Steinernema carpocapsae]